MLAIAATIAIAYFYQTLHLRRPQSQRGNEGYTARRDKIEGIAVNRQQD